MALKCESVWSFRFLSKNGEEKKKTRGNGGRKEMNRGGDGVVMAMVSVKLKGNDKEGEKGTKREEGRKLGKGNSRKKGRQRERE